MYDKQRNSLMRIIKTFLGGGIIIFGIGAFLMLSKDSNISKYSNLIFPISFIYIIGFVIFLIIYGTKKQKEYRNSLMTSTPKRNFKYLDSFYFMANNIIGGSSDDTSHSEMIIYHIIQDRDSEKIYAISEHETNAVLQVLLGNTKIFMTDDTKAISTKKDWKELNYYAEGSFWIEKEISEWYQNDGEFITITPFGEKKGYKVKYKNETSKLKVSGELYNVNPEYNVSLLDKATLIVGYAKFDPKQ